MIHDVSAANVSWPYGTVERMNREVVKSFREVLGERCRPFGGWLLALATVHWVLKSAYRERMSTDPFQIYGATPDGSVDECGGRR